MPRCADLLERPAPANTVQNGSAEVRRALAHCVGEGLYEMSESVDAQHGNDAAATRGKVGIDADGTSGKNASFALPLIGRSPPMLHLFSLIERIAPTDSSVLITGATGTGKELVARAVYQQSLRCAAPFVDINCSAIPDTLIEAELFGHERGSFTGAHQTKRGLFEQAAGGTLFLDEVHALSLPAQAKLLRVLQERQVRRVGGRENIFVNVRVISAANYDLQRGVGDGTFRADLLFRLRVMPLPVPELRERGEEDIRLLTKHFLQKYATRHGVPPRRFTKTAGDLLAAHSWPGNVRELENAVEYALVVGVDEELTVNNLPPSLLREVTNNRSFVKENFARKMTLAELERRYIMLALESFGGHQAKTAAALGITRRTLYRKLKEYAVVVAGTANDAA